MALAHAILASLLDEPRTGYDLAKSFGSDGYFWRATHQQIYRELARLEAEGSIAPTGGEAGPRGERRRAITLVGRRRLGDWGREPTDPATIKEDMLVKCLALEVMDAGDLIDQIALRREQHRERMHHHEQVVAEQFPDGPPPLGPLLGRYLAMQGGISYERSWIEWADFATSTLHQRQAARS